MSTVTSNVFRSKWGFHPCDHATFLKLRRLRQLYWKTVRAFAEWKRWSRKLPENRVIRKYLRDDAGRIYASEVVGPRPEPKWCPTFEAKSNKYVSLYSHWSQWLSDFGIEEAYQNARTPRATEEEVRPIHPNSLEKFEKLLSEAEKFYA